MQRETGNHSNKKILEEEDAEEEEGKKTFVVLVVMRKSEACQVISYQMTMALIVTNRVNWHQRTSKIFKRKRIESTRTTRTTTTMASIRIGIELS